MKGESYDDEREVGRFQPGEPGGPDPTDEEISSAVARARATGLLGFHASDLATRRALVAHPHPSSLKVLAATLGERCAEARRRLGFSQRALAKAMSMSPSWVREYEGGHQFAPPWLLVTLSEATTLPIGWFYGYGR
jgi:hypothetical protein